MLHRFDDRAQAGRLLAEKLLEYAGRPDAVVLGLPRGGIPVAYEVARRLNVPLDVFVVRKLGIPGQEECAFGAIATGGVEFVNKGYIEDFGIDSEAAAIIIEREKNILETRERLYHGQTPVRNLQDKTVIVVDDGLATGATMHAAVMVLKKYLPKKIIVAVPVAANEACGEFNEESDSRCVCLMAPRPFYAVGGWYQDFRQVSDQEVCRLLLNSQDERAA